MRTFRIGPGLLTANNRPPRPALAALDAIVTRLIATKSRRLVEEGGPQDGHRDLLPTLMLARDPAPITPKARVTLRPARPVVLRLERASLA